MFALVDSCLVSVSPTKECIMRQLDNFELSRLSTRQLIRYAKRQALDCMYGLVVEDNHTEIDDIPVTISKVKRFNRKTKMKMVQRGKDGNPTGDLSIIRTGKPGSRERIEAYRQWNECNNEVSPFMGE